MVPILIMNVKLKWLRDRIRTQDLQGMIVSNPVNIKYLTGILISRLNSLANKNALLLPRIPPFSIINTT